MEKTFKITYTGNSARAKRLVELRGRLVWAETARQAVEKFYKLFFDENYFPKENGEIWDSDGEIIATPDVDYIEFDGGRFEAVEFD